MTKQVAVKQQDKDNPMPTEVIAESIKSIADGIKRLRQSPLNDKALYLLIQHAAPGVKGSRYNTRPVTISEIKAVLDGIESLESVYLKPKKKPQ